MPRPQPDARGPFYQKRRSDVISEKLKVARRRTSMRDGEPIVYAVNYLVVSPLFQKTRGARSVFFILQGSSVLHSDRIFGVERQNRFISMDHNLHWLKANYVIHDAKHARDDGWMCYLRS